jgi:HK97 family phage prohead protease
MGAVELAQVAFGAVELRATSRREVEGIVAPYGETSYLTPDPHGERFLRGSLSRSVRDRGMRVKLFRNHDHSRAVGRATAWNADDPAGLWGRFKVAATPAGDEVLTEVREGTLDAFSIGFRALVTHRAVDSVREVVAAELHEVSIAPMGAYEGARVLALRTPGELLPPMPLVNLTPMPSRLTRRRIVL